MFVRNYQRWSKLSLGNMGFYDLTKHERLEQVAKISQCILEHLRKRSPTFFPFFSDEDTYIRKAAYQAVGKIFQKEADLRDHIILELEKGLMEGQEYARQTTINAAGEIGMKEFDVVEQFFDKGLFDSHHSVRNAVIGSIKKMGEKNPVPVLKWSRKYLHHPDKEVRREICHGIELRGRTHPEDILPMLRELQYDATARVRNTLIHVIGQISYKKGCLVKVISDLKTWENKQVVTEAINEIIDVHDRYKDFAVMSQEEAKKYIDEHL